MSNDIQRRMQELIPTGFEGTKQFITCNLFPSEKFPGKFDKYPVDQYGRKVSAHEQQNWLSAEDAVGRAIATGFHVGFAFSVYDPFWFIDLDSINEGGRWSQRALAICAMFPGCALEISQSGNGLHLFGSGDVGNHKKRVNGIEFYTEYRFVMLTGNGKTGDARRDFTPQLAQFITDYGFTPDPNEIHTIDWSTGFAPGANPHPEDSELIRVMLESAGGKDVQFGSAVHPRDLWHGTEAALRKFFPAENPHDPYDGSRADMALVNKLYYYTGGDAARIVRLFHASPYGRTRAPRHAGRPKLLEYALKKAPARTPTFYDRAWRSTPAAPVDRIGHTVQAIAAASWGQEQTGYAPPALPGPRDFTSANTLTQLMALDIPTPDFLVDGIMAPGVYLLIGKPKKGKSWMMMELALNVAIGGQFLDRKCKQGRVLYMALEDNRRRLQTRMHLMCPANFVTGSDQLLMLSIEDKIENMDHGFLENLRHTVLTQAGIVLLIVDTLSMVRFSKRGNEQLYDYDRRSIDPFVQLCAEYPNLTVLVVHHSRKNASDDPYDLASGTLGLTGAADGTFVLAVDPENHTMVFHGTGRDIEPIELAVKLSPPRWEVLGDPSEVGMGETQRKIIEAIRLNHGPMKSSEIAEAIGESRQNTSQRLMALLKRKQVMKTGDGKYIAHTGGESIHQ